MVQTIPNNVSTKQYMQPNEFCFWLQGLFELCPDLKNLTEAQVKMIRDHLNYVFEGKPTVIYTPPTVSSAITYPYTQDMGASSTAGLSTTLTTIC